MGMTKPSHRHSRESGNPVNAVQALGDPRSHGDDGALSGQIPVAMGMTKPSHRHSREGGNLVNAVEGLEVPVCTGMTVPCRGRSPLPRG
jgi:hypothetical protein